MRDALVIALAGHGTTIQASMQQALQTLAVAPPTLGLVAPAAVTVTPAPQHEHSALQMLAVTAVQKIAAAEIPVQANQQHDGTNGQHERLPQQHGGLRKIAAVAAQTDLKAPPPDAGIGSLKPSIAPAQLPAALAPSAAEKSGKSEAGGGGGEQAFAPCNSAKGMHASPVSAEGVHPPDAGSGNEAKRRRLSCAGVGSLASPSFLEGAELTSCSRVTAMNLTYQRQHPYFAPQVTLLVDVLRRLCIRDG